MTSIDNGRSSHYNSLEWEGSRDGKNDYDELLIRTPRPKRKRKQPMSPDRKVFVVSRGLHDFSGAEKFGELIFLCDELQVRLSGPAVYRKFTDILSAKSSPQDLILPTGLAYLNIIAGDIFRQLHDTLNLLIYKRNIKGYVIVNGTVPDFLKHLARTNTETKVLQV